MIDDNVKLYLNCLFLRIRTVFEGTGTLGGFESLSLTSARFYKVQIGTNVEIVFTSLHFNTKWQIEKLMSGALNSNGKRKYPMHVTWQ